MGIFPYVSALVEKYPTIREVWLFGSQANGTATLDSDWDLLVFSESDIFELLKNDLTIQSEKIDLLVRFGQEAEAKKPWGEEKSLNLEDWNWTVTGNGKATYRSSKFLDESPAGEGMTSGQFKIETLVAIRLWPTLQ